ncbi:MAG: hypothetical protein AAF486_05495 [Pseudomonadota bacterium]
MRPVLWLDTRLFVDKLTASAAHGYTVSKAGLSMTFGPQKKTVLRSPQGALDAL